MLIYLAMLNTARALGLWQLRRVLRVCPWQSVPGAASIAKNGTTRFSFADPELPVKTVSLGYGSFLGVVAIPGPRRLFGVAQSTAVEDRMSARKRGVSAEARERAKAAGARGG
ncbi:hypothetical protein OIE52_36580 [Streptomyces canus]|uniref:hypothetical protein n=1 Tax=Streptomyces canus TaxID=58343 RepID=UPI002E2AA76A|nr:hypothetical protein [Streptomyces canus]